MKIGNIAVLTGGLAAGSLAGSAIVHGSEQGSSAKAVTIAGGAAAALGGLGLAAATYFTHGSATSTFLKGANLLGVGLFAAGTSAAIGAALTKQRPASNPNGPAPAPGGASGSIAAMRELSTDAWAAQALDADSRSLLAAGAGATGTSGSAAARIAQELSADEWVGATYSPFERAQLAVAGVEAGRTGDQVATTQVNVDGSQDTSGTPATADLESTADRTMLAAAAIRGGRTGEDAAFTYAGIRNHDTDGIDPHQAARLAAAAMEGGGDLEGAVAAIDAISANAATRDLAKGAQVTLAGGAVRGGITGDQAAHAYATIVADPWVGSLVESADLSTDQVARLSAAASARGLSADDALLTFVNAAADEQVYDQAEDYEQVLDLAIGALAGNHTGEEAAAAYRAVSARDASTASLPVDTRFELAAAALAGGGAQAVIDAYRQSSTDSAFTGSTGEAADALLATGRGFDATSDSELLDWYAHQVG
jgi:hypothetical protein